ncbi:winged helix-turn-helix transcriptional regulator [Candidatus Woesearchaeota archaeon]|nr:winged helix-turn-helix transcriptional regulator [Candidatus Woesearchaeota archaeon]
MRKINKKVLQFFSALADETRLNILKSLAEKSKTVNEIYNVVGEEITLSAVSHQLKHMNDIGIVEFEKKGREKTFELSDNFCWCILRDAFDHFDGKTSCPHCIKIKNEKRK